MLNQKELKEMYKEELKKVWSDEKFVDYWFKKAAFVVEHNGEIFEIDKPTIEKDFCFGYGMYGRSSEEDEKRAFEREEVARTSEEYFKKENMKEIDKTINFLEDLLYSIEKGNNCPKYNLAIYKKGSGNVCNLRTFSFISFFDKDEKCEVRNDPELIKKLIEGYQEVKKSFEKRLNSYLKRYGLSKINTWTYLVD